METIETITNRRSIRKYEADFKVSESDIKKILEAGMYAPSAMHKEPWEFIVYTDNEKLKLIQENHPYASFLNDAGTGILVCLDVSQEYNGMGIVDVSVASQNIMLMAHDMGYGTCFCGIYPDKCEKFNTLLNLPEHIVPIGLIALGKPLSSPHKPERYDETKVHFNNW